VSQNSHKLHLIFDLDGVIYHGDRANPGAVEVLNWVQEQAIPYHFHTNAGQRTREEIQTKLALLDIHCSTSDITTASETVAALVRADFPDINSVYTIGGGAGLRHELELLDIESLAIEEVNIAEIGVCPPRPLVIGLTRDFNYGMVSKLLLMEDNISTIYATDNDARFVADQQVFPGTGWQNAAIGCVLNKPVTSSGKPSVQALGYVLTRKLETTGGNIVIIGDNIYSDIAGGNAMKCKTILIMGGTTLDSQLEDLADEIYKPTYIAQNMTSCGDILRQLHKQPE